MYLITVYNMYSKTYWTPVLAISEFAMNAYVQQVARLNKQVMYRVDYLKDETIVDNFKAGGAKVLRYEKMPDNSWAWVAK